MATYGVFIGRFQPFHNAHFEILKHSLGRFDRVIVCIGSANQARSPKNPFSAKFRQKMIESCLTADQLERVAFIHVRDYMYNENQWITELQYKVQAIVEQDPGPISIVGRLKDRSSYYLRLFPQWKCEEYFTKHPLNATDIRYLMYNSPDVLSITEPKLREVVPDQVSSNLLAWMATDDYRWVRDEFWFIKSYKDEWSEAPYPPTFVTVDSIVAQSGHILVVKRRSAPGAGLLALPGGFLNEFETTEAGALRELKEETGIQMPKEVLQKCITECRVFDHPDRSLRGRTLTHAYCIKLPDGDLASVKGADDAEKAFWMPLADIYANEDQFFEDHLHIIRYFANRF